MKVPSYLRRSKVGGDARALRRSKNPGHFLGVSSAELVIMMISPVGLLVWFFWKSIVGWGVHTRVLTFVIPFKNAHIVSFAVGLDCEGESADAASHDENVDTGSWFSFHLGILDVWHV